MNFNKVCLFMYCLWSSLKCHYKGLFSLIFVQDCRFLLLHILPPSMCTFIYSGRQLDLLLLASNKSTSSHTVSPERCSMSKIDRMITLTKGTSNKGNLHPPAWSDKTLNSATCSSLENHTEVTSGSPAFMFGHELEFLIISTSLCLPGIEWEADIPYKVCAGLIWVNVFPDSLIIVLNVGVKGQYCAFKSKPEGPLFTLMIVF